MKKYKITTAKNAVNKCLVKVGDVIWVKSIVTQIDLQECPYQLCIKNSGMVGWLRSEENIRIPIPEQKPIDFGEAGRVLKYGTTVIMTTGFLSSIDRFSGYVLESEVYDKGYTNNEWPFSNDWNDITDTYKK